MLLLVIQAKSQCDNEVSTNPLAPTNLALPDSTGAVNNPDERYLNGLDWINGNIPGTTGYSLTNMYYNFPSQPLVQMSNIQNSNIATDYSYLNTALGAELMTNSVGWELLLVNLGRYPDNTTPNPDFSLNVVPYLVFYNRYSGIVRVFVQYGANEPPTNTVAGVKINLYYNINQNANNLSGIFRLGEGNDKALDQPTDILRLAAIAPRNGQNNFWMSADFQTTYDPCVCTYPTNLKLDFEFYSTAELKLYGRGITINEDLVANSSSVLNNEFLSNLDYTANTSGDGFIMYKAMENLIDDYIARMEQYEDSLDLVGEINKKVKQNLLIIKATKVVIQVGMALAVGSPQVSALQLGASEFFFGDTTKASKEKVKKLLEKAEKIIGEELKMYINKNFVTQDKPQKPVSPTASFTEMNFVGNLSSSTSINGPFFNTPGSFKNNSLTNDLPAGGLPTGYPVFNQPLGTFALLTTPKVILSETIEDEFVNQENFWELNQNQVSQFNISAPYDQWVPAIHINSGVYQNWTRSYQLKLLNDLKYTFNTSLDIKGEPVVQAAFVLTAKPTRVDNETISGGGSRQNSFIDPTYTTNVESMNTDVDEYSIVFGQTGHEFEEGNNDYLKLNPKSNFSLPNYFLHTSLLKKDKLEFSTPYLPINSFYPSVFAVGLKNERIKLRTHIINPESIGNPEVFIENGVLQGIFPDLSTMEFSKEPAIDPSKYGFKLSAFDIELKISVTMEFNTLRPDGTNNQVTQIYTYKVPNDASHIAWDMTNPLYPNLEGSNGDITQYPENLSFTEDVDFNGSPVDGCKYSNNHYTCRAWNSIIIDANLKSTNGKTADFIAGQIIEVYPEAIVLPEVDLYIQTVLDYSHPLPPSDPAYVSSFCSKSLGANEPAYQANIPSKNMLSYLADEEASREDNVGPSNPLSVALFPNPAKNTTTVQLSRLIGNAQLRVQDMMGRDVQIEIIQNGLSFELDISQLKQGMYFVNVSTVEGTITKNLIVK